MNRVSPAVTAFIGLGSNLDNPQGQVEQALEELPQLPDTSLTWTTPHDRSTAVGPGGKPDYINAVARIMTSLERWSLLDQLQALEQPDQRVRLEPWGPRTLDQDQLLYDGQVISR